MDILNKENISKTEKDILFHLINQNDIMTCNHIIIFDEKLRRKHSVDELVKAGNNLESHKLIDFKNKQNGHIWDSISLKKIKRLFPIKYLFIRTKYIFRRNIFRIILGFWNNVIVKIAVPILVAYLLIRLGLKQ